MSRTRQPRQLSFFKIPRRDHGGDIRAGKRKEARPFDPKCPLHIVFRSARARGAWSMLQPKHKRRISHLVQHHATRSGVRVYRFTNVGNHLHLLVKARDQAAFQKFLRSLSGRIAALITNAKRGKPSGKFWDQLAYSRIVSWGREFKTLEIYFIKNLFEAAGFWNRKKDPGREFCYFSTA